MNNRGFAITTLLYGILIIFLFLFASLIGMLSTYKDSLEKLVENNHGAREIITMKLNNHEYDGTRGLYCSDGVCKYYKAS